MTDQPLSAQNDGAVFWSMFDEYGNQVDSFASRVEAHAALRREMEADPEHVVGLLAFDAEGHALGPAVLVEDLPPYTVEITRRP